MKLCSVLSCALLALIFAGCAGGRVVEGLHGRYQRSFAYDEDDNRAQVSEVWQFNGTSASSHATWNGAAQSGPYKTVVDQGWSVTYRGRGVFLLEEKGRQLDGPPLADLADEYEMELDGSEVAVDGGPSDEPLRRPSGTTATAPAAVKHSASKKKKR